MNQYMNYHSPVAIGGVGGSGTRLIGEVLKKTGFYIGNDLNSANDNLWFTLLFKRTELLNKDTEKIDILAMINLFYNAMIIHQPLNQKEVNLIKKIASEDRPQHSAAWLKKRSKSMQKAIKQSVEPNNCWGWKEPNTHIFLDILEQEIPGLKYIHVMRHGLDMAHSSNQNQLKLWGPIFLGPEYADVTPCNSLKFWCYAHRRVIRLGKKMGNRFLLLDYNKLCSNPEKNLPDILEFLNVEPKKQIVEDIQNLIIEPQSMGRYKAFDLDIYDPKDVEYVKQLGFTVEGYK